MGTKTTKGYFYKPAYGASGETEMGYFHAALDVTDAQLPIFPQNYGSGSGTSESPWTGLASAYTACPTGGTIYCRAGYYQLTGVCTINKAINIIGEGMGRTFVVTDNNHGFSADEIDYITIKNLTIDGVAQTDGVSRACIRLATCEHSLVENVETKNGGYSAIDNYESNYSVFRNIYTHDNHMSGFHPGAASADTNKYNLYDGIYSWNNGNIGFNAGAQTYYGSNNVYNNMHCWDNTNHGIAITWEKGSVLSNSSARGSGVNGIYIKALEDCTIENCFVDLSTSQGILVSTLCKNLSFTNVIVKNSNAQAGVVLYTASGVTFTSCQFYDDQGSPTQTYGIKLFDTNTGVSILNCKLSPNVTGEIYTNGTSTYAVFNLAATSAAGDILYFNGTNWVRLAKGTAGQVLTMNAGATAPEWQTP